MSFVQNLLAKISLLQSNESSNIIINNEELEDVGWAIQMISPEEISAGMLHQPSPYNLNQQAMDCTMGLLEQVLQAIPSVTEVYYG